MLRIITNSLFITLFLIALQVIIGLFIGVINRMFFKNYYRIFKNGNPDNHNLITIIGTPVHEFGHYIMCKIFRIKVLEVKFLEFNKDSSSLGNVEFEYGEGFFELLSLFFISIGPLYSSGIITLLLTSFFKGNFIIDFINITEKVLYVGGINSLEILFSLLKGFFNEFLMVENVTSIKFWMLIFIAISISLSSSLSKTDISILKKGIPYLIPFIVITNLLNSLIFKVEIINMIFVNINLITLSIMVILLFFSLLALLFTSMILYVFKFLERLKMKIVLNKI